MNKKKICIIGGGLSGLIAGYELGKKIGKNAEITIIEKEKRIGGRVLTKYFDDCPIELGAQFFVEQGKVLELIKKLGLGSDIITLNKKFLSFYYEDHLYSRDKLRDIEIIKINKGEMEKIFSSIKEIKPSEDVILKNFEEWYKENIGSELLNFWNRLLISIGVKSIKAINAFFGLILIRVFFGENYLLQSGLNKFIKRLEEEILAYNINIIKETECVSIIDQKSKEIIVEYNKDKKITKEKFDYVVFAITPEKLCYIKGLEKLKDISKIQGHPMALYVINVNQKMWHKTWGLIILNENSPIYALCNWNNVLNIKENSPILAICNPYEDKNRIINEIKKMFPGGEEDCKIIHEKLWDVGLHQADKNFFSLQKSIHDDISKQIYFAGDWMELPALEGAVRSGFKASKLLIKDFITNS